MSSAAPLLVGIDVGTTRIKAGLIDLDGRELARAQVPTAWCHHIDGTDARPDNFIHAVEQACTELLARAPAGEIAGVGITSMAETVILVGPDGAGLGPSIAWHDRRAVKEATDMAAALTPVAIRRATGLTDEPIPTVAVLRWLMRSFPELRKAVQVLSVAEWIAYRLGGDRASELSLASRTGALAIAPAKWWSEAIEWAGIKRSLFGELRPAGSSWGTIAHPRPGLDRLAGAALTVAGHDHLTAAIGSGITGPAQIMDSCGTAEAILRAITPDPALDPARDIPPGIAIGWHALPAHHCLIAGLSLGIELTPLLERLGAALADGCTSLDAAALGLLSGVRPPSTQSAAARAWLAEVRQAVDRAALRRSEIAQFDGPVTQVRISGGWSRNPLLRHLKELDFADTVYPSVIEAGVRGAGLMAGLAAGIFESVERFPAPAMTEHDGGSTLSPEPLPTHLEVP